MRLRCGRPTARIELEALPFLQGQHQVEDAAEIALLPIQVRNGTERSGME
jgi:hypothetical protein